MNQNHQLSHLLPIGTVQSQLSVRSGKTGRNASGVGRLLPITRCIDGLATFWWSANGNYASRLGSPLTSAANSTLIKKSLGNFQEIDLVSAGTMSHLWPTII